MGDKKDLKEAMCPSVTDTPSTPYSRSPPAPVDSGYCGLDTPRAPSRRPLLPPRDLEYSVSDTPRLSLRRRPILQQASPPPLEALRPLVKASAPTPQSLAPLVQILVVVIVGSSIGYGLLCGTNRTRGSLKYESINYGSDEASWGNDVDMSVTDGESGEELGGKRAALQFYHDRSKQRVEEEKEEQRRFP